jgi:hypothetical protein
MPPNACLLRMYLLLLCCRLFPFPFPHAQKTPGYPVPTISLFQMIAKSGTRTPHLSPRLPRAEGRFVPEREHCRLSLLLKPRTRLARRMRLFCPGP